MRTWDEIDRNYVETFKYRIKILFEDYYQARAVKKFFEEMKALEQKSFYHWFDRYVWLFELLNKHRRRFFSGELQGRVQNFLMYELMMQEEAHWKENQKVSEEIDVITLSIAQMSRAMVPGYKFEAAPCVVEVNPKVSMSERLVTPGVSFGMGVLFACIATAVVITLPVSWPFMIGAIVGAGILGLVMGFGAKKIVDYTSPPPQKKPAEPDTGMKTRPRGISDVYRTFLDLDRELHASSRPQTPIPLRVTRPLSVSSSSSSSLTRSSSDLPDAPRFNGRC